jgi:hypothetical protein
MATLLNNVSTGTVGEPVTWAGGAGTLQVSGNLNGAKVVLSTPGPSYYRGEGIRTAMGEQSVKPAWPEDVSREIVGIQVAARRLVQEWTSQRAVRSAGSYAVDLPAGQVRASLFGGHPVGVTVSLS